MLGKNEFLVDFLDAFYVKSSYCIVLPWLDGVSVYEKYCKIKKVPNDSVIMEIAFQVLNALEFMHEKKLAHCDIKPENLQKMPKSLINLEVFT